MTNEPNPGDVVTWVERFEFDGQIVEVVKWLRTTAISFAVVSWYAKELPGRHWWICAEPNDFISYPTNEAGAIDALAEGVHDLAGFYD